MRRRLTSATITWLLYAAYLPLRQGIEDPQRRARFAAVYGVIAFASVPLTFAAVRIFRSIHPVVIGAGAPGAKGSFDMTPAMRDTLLFSVLVYSAVRHAVMAPAAPGAAQRARGADAPAVVARLMRPW